MYMYMWLYGYMFIYTYKCQSVFIPMLFSLWPHSSSGLVCGCAGDAEVFRILVQLNVQDMGSITMFAAAAASTSHILSQ